MWKRRGVLNKEKITGWKKAGIKYAQVEECVVSSLQQLPYNEINFETWRRIRSAWLKSCTDFIVCEGKVSSGWLVWIVVICQNFLTITYWRVLKLFFVCLFLPWTRQNFFERLFCFQQPSSNNRMVVDDQLTNTVAPFVRGTWAWTTLTQRKAVCSAYTPCTLGSDVVARALLQTVVRKPSFWVLLALNRCEHIVGIESIASDQEPTQFRETWPGSNITNLHMFSTFGVGRQFARRADVKRSLRQELGQINRPCPTPLHGRWHHLGPPHIESRRCEPFHQPWRNLTSHGETDGLNPLQHAIGEPPPFPHANENRTSYLMLQRHVYWCRRTNVEPRNKAAFHASSCQQPVDNPKSLGRKQNHPGDTGPQLQSVLVDGGPCASQFATSCTQGTSTEGWGTLGIPRDQNEDVPASSNSEATSAWERIGARSRRAVGNIPGHAYHWWANVPCALPQKEHDGSVRWFSAVIRLGHWRLPVTMEK